MSFDEATVSIDLHDYLGDAFDIRRTKVFVTTNIPGNAVHDNASGETRLGSGRVVLASDGTVAVTVPVPGADTNPASWQTTISVDFADPATSTRYVRSFGPFTITEDATLPDLVEEQEVPPTYLTTVTSLLDGYVSDASTEADRAEAAADLAADISGIATSDDVVKVLIEDPDSDTSAALTASFVGTGVDVRTALNAKVRRARPQMVLSFDDAPLTDWTVVKPILDAAGVKGVFCLTTDEVVGGITWAHATALAAAGHELVAHSASHPDLSDADAADVAAEVTASFAAIKTNTGYDATGFCYPFGANNELVRDEVRRLGSFGLGDTVEGANTQPFATYNLLRRHIENARAYATYTGWVDDAVAHNRLLIILVHSGYDFNATQQGYLADLIDYAQGEGVEITTLSEALAASGNVLDAGDYPKDVGTVISGEGVIAYSPNVAPAAVMSTADLSTSNQGSYAALATTVTAVASSTGKILVRIDGHSSSTSAGSTQFFSCSGNNSAGVKYFADLLYTNTARWNHAGAVVYTGLTPGTAYTFTIGVKVDAGTWNCRCSSFPENEAFTVSAFQVA